MTEKTGAKAALLAFFTMVVPVGAAAQDCGLRLTAFSEAATTYARDVASLTERLSDLFTGFAAIEAAWVETPEQCPAALDDSRAAAADLDWAPLVARSEVLLDCGQFFNRRILADIAQAKADNDGQLILRLGVVQERIFDIEQSVLEATTQATFLGLRADGLVAEHDALANRCTILGDIYD